MASRSRAFVMMILACLGLSAAVGAPQAGPNEPKIRVLLVTGGHEYDHDPFVAVFKAMPDVQLTAATHPADGNVFEPAKPAEAYKEGFPYDVIVLYDMWQKASDAAKERLLTLLKRGKGLVAMHHALGTYQDWPEYEKIIGGKFFLKPAGGHDVSTYKHDVEIPVRIADPKHPIVAGMKDFTIHDETYGRFAVAADVRPLLATDHPDSGKTLAWTNRYGNARVVYLQLGHDAKAYANESFRTVLHRSIQWSACRIPPATRDKDGFQSLFNGKDLDGWVVMGNPAGFVVRDGVIRSDGETGGDWLRSTRQYADFVLKVDWRVSPNGNSGVFIRCAEDGYPWETGSEIQITNAPRDDAHCTGSLYGSVAVNPRPDESADRWHTFEIRCAGPKITVLSDGVQVVSADCEEVDALRKRPRAGYIGLQDSHAPKGSCIEYRNIRIRTVDPR